MSNLTILIGNIGSGKTTIAKELVKQGYLAVSRDWLRYGIREGTYIFDPDLESLIFSTEWHLFKNLILSGYDIVLDEVNISKKARKKYIDYARDFAYTVTARVMPKLTKTESIKRRLKDNHGGSTVTTWKKVWSAFNRLYEVPTYEEGFDEIFEYATNNLPDLKGN